MKHIGRGGQTESLIFSLCCEVSQITIGSLFLPILGIYVYTPVLFSFAYVDFTVFSGPFGRCRKLKYPPDVWQPTTERVNGLGCYTAAELALRTYNILVRSHATEDGCPRATETFG